MKICTKCKIEKSEDAFYNWKHGKDGKFHQCKECGSKTNKLYRQKNREALLEYNREYGKKHYAKNKEIVDANHKEDYEKNKEKWKSTRKKYYEENKERLMRLQKERLKDPTKRKQHNEVSAKRDRERCKTDPNYKLKKYLRARIWGALRGKYKTKRTEELLGTSVENVKSHLEAKFSDGMSWENYGKWHVDHIMPCDAFDLSLEENQKQCFHYTNLQPLWAEDNMRKSNIIPTTHQSVLAPVQ